MSKNASSTTSQPTTMSIEPQKIALVTGANRGIGQEIANQLQERGIRVFRGYRTPSSLLAIHEKHGIQLDIADSNSIQNSVSHILKETDKLDILINNAATLLDRELPLEELTVETFKQTLEINTVAAFELTQAYLPLLKPATHSRVINISSGAGQLQDMMQWSPAYGISKAALNALTIQQSLAYSKYGISVNCVRPGWVRTRMGGDQAPLSVSEGADTATWLALDANPNETGKLWFERKPTHW